MWLDSNNRNRKRTVISLSHAHTYDTELRLCLWANYFRRVVRFVVPVHFTAVPERPINEASTAIGFNVDSQALQFSDGRTSL